MKTLLTKRFWLDALERGVKTFLQTAIAVTGIGAVDILSVDWKAALVASGTAAGLSLLTSVVSVLQADSISPASLVPPT